MMTGPWLLYGANGFTGQLVARLALARGHQPILAGRRADAICALSDELNVSRRLFSLDDPAHIEEGLAGMNLVLHCAGPFSRTARPMVEACLRTRTHYLDITGEVAVFEALAARGDEAAGEGVTLLPGCGFDVVPTDCLALHLKKRMPGARRLALGFETTGRVSRGTALTALEGLPGGGLVRRGGVLTGVPAAWRTRTIDFGCGPRTALTIPWGDVATAGRSTGIPDVEVYMAAPLAFRLFVRASRRLGPALGWPWVRALLRRRILAGPPGPSEDEQRQGRSWIWGEVEGEAGRVAVSRLVAPEAYTLTARAALAAVEKVLQGAASPGFQTPSRAFGADFVLGVEGVTRQDEEERASRGQAEGGTADSRAAAS